jgi:hypothetical protein
MGIGAGIFLIAVGAILAFAVDYSVSGVDIAIIGYILMGAGVLGLILALILSAQRSNTTHTQLEDRNVHRDRNVRGDDRGY